MILTKKKKLPVKIPDLSEEAADPEAESLKKSQIIPGIIVLLVIIAIGIVLAAVKPMLGFFWVTGNAFGFILQRARFCFTASLRDPYLTGGTSLTKAVLTAFAITSIGFIAIQYGAVSKGLPMPGQAYVVPVSAATAVGAFMFGIGMVIAGGCASGTCMRVGEGFHMQMLSLFFFCNRFPLGSS